MSVTEFSLSLSLSLSLSKTSLPSIATVFPLRIKHVTFPNIRAVNCYCLHPPYKTCNSTKHPCRQMLLSSRSLQIMSLSQTSVMSIATVFTLLIKHLAVPNIRAVNCYCLPVPYKSYQCPKHPCRQLLLFSPSM